MDSLIGFKVSLDEVKKVFEYQLESVTGYKEASKNVFGAASLIITLLGSLQLLLGKVSDMWLTTYQTLLIIALVVYIAIILVTIFLLMPTSLQAPIRASWEVLEDTFFYKDEKEVILFQLNQYLVVIDKNKAICGRLRMLMSLIGILLVGLIMVFAVLMFMPKV